MDYNKTGPVVPQNAGKQASTTKPAGKKNSKDEIIINPVEKQDGMVNERFLNVVQRLRRGQQMRRREPILKLKKAVAKFRPHTKAQLKIKASQIAKSAARRRFAGARGASYEKLGTTDKVQVDRSLESKAKIIQRMAKRLTPQLRSADVARLSDVRKGKRAKSLAKYLRGGVLNQSFSLEDVSKLYDYLTEKDVSALEKKSNLSGIPLEIIKEIFARGLSESTKQRAFERVNSFIAGGAARYLDEDLDKKDKREREDSEEEDIVDTSDFKLDKRGRKVRAGRIRFEQLEDGTKRIVLEAKKMKGPDPCWDGYHMVGTKKKGGKEVPNCVPEELQLEEPQVGDAVDIELDDIAFETSIVDIVEDGVVIQVDQTTLDALLNAQAELVEGEGIVTPRKMYRGEPPKGSYAWERKYGKYTAKGTLRKRPNPNKPPVEDIKEAEYQGRDVPLGKPMAGDVKKSKVYVKGPSGRVVKVNFGDKNMTIKKDNPARRKSFRARHNCDNPGPRHKARYWSCRAW